MSLWKKKASISDLNVFSQNTLVSHLGIEITEIGDDSITATMPVDERTRQPMGFLHGGASVVLAETLGSVAAHLMAEENTVSFGVEVNANHLRSVRAGTVTGVARALRIGTTLQVWDIQISDERGELVCASRLTVAVRLAR
ncbi:uncharacterized protein (TIGR00369 family) [Alteromonadaceae bacterium 2753L.S.0a.02]|nr:uncharacterized protein (TIGR00369 family) [Alteromonadaceae bacterium 2753L.S.0a.02]